ncbi:hypothetical protein [Campylobacter sp.]|uniref:hypothetical protein n=1 Tax=Campylobacter sp. TaxID=205 RepID=UPI002AA8848A|nr:hypothetical protein [Campylobacter sp.]MCI7581799.1 hypothetical protein [Campylobacter sp.]
MANSQINISINAQDNASVAINSTTNSLSRMRQNIDMAAHSLQAYTLGLEVLKNQLIPLATAGISANAQLESLQTKLTGLISANSANVTSTGEIINAQQKWQKNLEFPS